MATSNMGLGTSTAGVDTDANAASREQANLLLLDNHDHTSGKGVKVPTGGLNINADLPMASNSLTGLKSNQFSSQTSALVTTNTLYVKNGELFYIDNSGNAVQITSGGAVSVSTLASGSVLLDAGNARGANLRAGTNDAYSMILETNNIDRFSVDSNGLAKFIYDFAVQKGSANTSTGTINDVSTSQKSYFQFTGAGAVTVTGFANGSDGKVILLTNKTGSQLTINNNDSGSSAANRILTGTGASLSVENNASIMAVYDSTNSLWNIVGGTGGASGGKPVYSIDLSSGSLYNDSAATPVDGTGGTTTGMTYASVTSGTLRGAVSYKLSKDAANRQGCGVAYSLTIDNVDKSSTQSVQFDISTSANFASGDAYLYIYDITNSVMLPVISVLPTGIQPQFSRAVNLTTGTSYRILLHVASTSALAYDITVDAMTVDSIVRPQVAGIGDWKVSSVTYSGGFGTVTNNVCEERREGDSIVFRGSLTSTSPAATIASVTIPYTIDTTKLSIPANTSAQDGNTVGTWTGNVAGVSNAGYILTAPATSTTTLYFSRQLLDNASHLTPSSSTSTQVTTGGIVAWEARIPVANLSSNITLSSTSGAIEYQSNSSSTDADDTTSFVAGASGSVGILNTTTLTASRRKRVQFSTPIQPTDRIVIEFSSANGAAPWTPAIGYDTGVTGYQVTSYFNYGAPAAQTQGIGYKPVTGSTTQLDVTFGTYMNQFGGAANWNVNFPTGTRWRVAKYSAIGGAELAPATSTSSGTISRESPTQTYVPTITGLGTVSGSLATYRVIGDMLEVNGSFTTGTTTATAVSISLPTGFTINNSKLCIQGNALGTSGAWVGNIQNTNAGQYNNIVTHPGTSTTLVYGGASSGATMFIAANGNPNYSGSTFHNYKFSVPIV